MVSKIKEKDAAKRVIDKANCISTFWDKKTTKSNNQNLELRNYKQYKELSLPFREGLVGIIGRNGAGKSTLFDAILYCLFGRDENRKDLIRSAFSSSKADVRLELQFQIGEQSYLVKREFRGKALTTNAELFKEGSFRLLKEILQ